MKRPLAMNRVDRELRNQFKLLMEALKVVNTDREEIEYEALNRRILQEVTDKPILARIIVSRAGAGAGVSLLLVACTKLNLDTSHDVIKSLIQAYPRALITTSNYSWYGYRIPICMIAKHPQHCILMPWIAINYSSVLDHEFDRATFPEFAHDLLDTYRYRSCKASIVKNFFEAYPRALNQDQLHKGNGLTLIHKVLKPTYQQGAEVLKECEADLFQWMAERCPYSHLLETSNTEGSTPLHLACKELAKYKGRDSSEICKFLIDKCPDAVRVRQTRGIDRGTNPIYEYGYLPLHYLVGECNYRYVREVVVPLLREYPGSYHLQAYAGDPRSVPFIQSIKPYLNEEKDLKKTVKSLADSVSSLTEALAYTNDQSLRSTCNVFDSWCTTFINTTEDKVKLISTQLQDMCNEGDEFISL